MKKGVIHIGANIGQERGTYGSLNVLWIEPIPSIFNQLVFNIKNFPTQTALNYLISDVDGKEYDFYVSNQSDRSSFLKFTDHHFKDKGFTHTETLKLKSIRMDTLIDNLKIDLSDYDGVVTDCQGADYFAIKSFGDYINHFSYIKSEVMRSEIYEGLKDESEINQYITSFGFSLVSNDEYAINGTQRDNTYIK
jgi:FkbM family methyltransferase